MQTPRKVRAFAGIILTLLLLAQLGWIAPVHTAQAADNKGKKHNNASPHDTSFTQIAGNPLTIQVGPDGSFQVENANDPVSTTGGQFYPTDSQPGDAGIFLTTQVGSTNYVFGPDFGNHNGGTATPPDVYDQYTPVSQTPVTGSGTAADPYKVITVLDVPNTAIRITQTTTYVNGALKFSQTWNFSNNGNGLPTPLFNYYYAGDIYFQGSDDGFGYFDPGTGSVGGVNESNTAYILFVPDTRADAHYEGPYHDVWDRIGTSGTPGVGFDDTVAFDQDIDNGAGLQWNNRTVGSSLASTVQIGLGAAPTPAPYTYYLPFVANAYQQPGTSGTFSTYIAVQNTSSTAANIHIYYYDVNGSNFANDTTTCPNLAALAECLPVTSNVFSSGSRGAAIITSDQLLNVVVAESTPYGGSAYTVNQGATNSSIAPLAIKNSINFVTQINIFNGANTATTANVQFYDQTGNHVAAADKSLTINAHTTTTLDQATDSSLPSGFYGWASVTGPTGSQLVVQVLEQRPDVRFVAVASGIPTPSSTLYAPILFNNAIGGFVTGANIINPNSTPVTVTITYYDATGNPTTATPFTVPANGVILVYQPNSSSQGVPSGGLANGYYGPATVTSAGGNIAMVVNEAGGLTSTGSARSGTYAAALNGGTNVGLPVTANNGFGYTTGATFVNTSGTQIQGAIRYYDVTGSQVGSDQPFTIAPHSSVLQFQGSSSVGLPSNFYGTALASVSSGPAASLIVTANAQSSSFFYTYTEPNQ